MKRKILYLSFIFFLAFGYSQNISVEESEMSLYAGMTSAYKSSSYPAVVEYSVRLEKQFPHSEFLTEAGLYRGECYFYLGQYFESLESLKSVLAQKNISYEEKLKSLYFCARCNYELERNKQALQYFNEAATLYNENKSESNSEQKKIYYSSLVYSALLFQKDEDYKTATSLYETSLQNGKYLTQKEFETLLTELFECYKKTKSIKNSEKLYSFVDKNQDKISLLTYVKSSFTVAEAYEELNDWVKAYKIYKKLLQLQELSAVNHAMQKACELSESHYNVIREDPGAILAGMEDKFQDNKPLLSEFWTRLAISAFWEGDYKKATNYFTKASGADEEKKYTAIISLYLSVMDEASPVKHLNEYVSQNPVKEEDEFYFEYKAAYARAYAFEKDWDKCIENANVIIENFSNEKISKNVFYQTLYFASAAFFEKEKYFRAETLLKNYCPVVLSSSNNLSQREKSFYYSSNILLAKTYAMQKKYAQAQSVYENIDSSFFTDSDRLEYAKVLFYNNQIDLCLKQTLRLKSQESNQLSGLCFFNRADYTNAKKYLQKYIESKSLLDKSYAQFYYAWSLLKLQDKNAFDKFKSFLDSYPEHQMYYKACMLASQSALLLSDFEGAQKYAQRAVEISNDAAKKQESVILLSNVYVDSNETLKALDLLLPYTKEESAFGMQSNFSVAQLYASLNEINKSDEYYKNVELKYPKEALADEACYRRGEIFYTAQDYEEAIKRFERYQKKFPDGKYNEAARFYDADCYSLKGNSERAIVGYKALLQINEKSSFAFNARKNIVELYERIGNYQEALNQLNELIKLFPEESKKEGLSSKVDELKNLTSGLDPEYIKLKKAYEDLNGLASKEGRDAGTDLILFMSENSYPQNEILTLANNLFELQSKKQNVSNEAANAAKTSYIIARINRQSDLKNDSAKMFLESAKYARQCGNHLLAQQALYGAIESYISEGFKMDADATYEKLHQWYPDCEFDISAKDLLNRSK